MRRLEPFDKVRAIARAVPGVEEGVSWGVPSLKVNGRMLAAMAIHPSAEPGSMVVRVNIEQRDAMIAEQPETYYITEHYVNYPSVLVRLAMIHSDALRDLLMEAARSASERSRVRATRRKTAAQPARRAGTRRRSRP